MWNYELRKDQYQIKDMETYPTKVAVLENIVLTNNLKTKNTWKNSWKVRRTSHWGILKTTFASNHKIYQECLIAAHACAA